MKLYGNARYDLVSEVFSELLGGLRYFPSANLSLTAEYYQSYPTFDTTSIYSVFAVNRYKEALVRADYSMTEKLSVYGGFTRQDFGDADGEGNVYIVGITLRPFTTLTIDIDYDRREGYGGTLNGGTLEVNFDATPALRLAAGAAYDVYQRDSMTGEATARNYWVGARYKLTKKMSASLRIEESSNKTYSSNSQGRFVFDYDF
jgi:predicted porin